MPNGPVGGVTDRRKVKKSVLRNRDLTGKYEKGVIMTIKISHLGFSVVLIPNLKSDFKIFSSRGPRPQKTVFQKIRSHLGPVPQDERKALRSKA